jgi:hypothetical protein
MMPFVDLAADKEEPRPGGDGARRSEMAGSTGFEPAVSSVTGWHVRPLHHEPLPTAKDSRWTVYLPVDIQKFAREGGR